MYLMSMIELSNAPFSLVDESVHLYSSLILPVLICIVSSLNFTQDQPGPSLFLTTTLPVGR